MATRAKVEGILIKRCGVLMRAAGLDGTTEAGTNADLNASIGYALRQLGLPTADITAVTTAEVEAVAAKDIGRFLDVAEKHVLQTVVFALNDVNVFVGPKSDDYSRLAAYVQACIDRKL